MDTIPVEIKLTLIQNLGFIKMQTNDTIVYFTPDQCRNLAMSLRNAADKLDQLRGVNVKKKRHGR